MSHFTRIATKLVDRELLTSALTDLGYKVQAGNVTISGWNGRKMQAELKIPTGNPQYDIGFARSGDSYDLVADWYGIKGIQQADLVRQLSVRYAYHATRKSLEQQGFSIVKEESQATGEVHLLLRRA